MTDKKGQRLHPRGRTTRKSLASDCSIGFGAHVALDCWSRAGITAGSKVIDVGAGPGYATVDLAEIVGPTGRILAIERSARFLEVAKQACAMRGLTNVQFRQADLMEEPLGQPGADVAWCRWVASFVASPEKLIRANCRRASVRRCRHFSRVSSLPHIQIGATTPGGRKLRGRGGGQLEGVGWRSRCHAAFSASSLCGRPSRS